MASLVLAASAALLLFVIWRIWHTEEPVLRAERTLSDVELDYKCERRHKFRAFGRAEPRVCPVCGQPAYPWVTYACEIHGTFEVMARLETDRTGVTKVSHLRLPGRDWLPVERTLRCPRCNGILERLTDDPLDTLRRRQKKGG